MLNQMKPLSKEEWEKIKEKEKLLNEISKVLKVNIDQIVNKLNKFISENKEMKKEIARLTDKNETSK